MIGERLGRYLFRSAFKELLRKTLGDYMGEPFKRYLLRSALKELLRKTLGD